MSKKKKGRFISRLIWFVFIVGFFALGVVLFLSTLPSVGVLINYNKEFFSGTVTFAFSCALKGFGALFGGEVDEFAVSANATAGDYEFELPASLMPSLGGELAFNYVVLISLILAVLGILIALLFFKKKSVSLVASLFIIAGAILLCIDSLLYVHINSEALGFLKDANGISLIDVPSLLLGIFSALSGITVFFHALTIKK